MEKTISGHGQVVKMICTRLPDCTFTKLHSPCNHHIAMMSKRRYMRLGLNYAQHSNTPLLQQNGIGRANYQ